MTVKPIRIVLSVVHDSVSLLVPSYGTELNKMEWHRKTDSHVNGFTCIRRIELVISLDFSYYSCLSRNVTNFIHLFVSVAGAIRDVIRNSSRSRLTAEDTRYERFRWCGDRHVLLDSSSRCIWQLDNQTHLSPNSPIVVDARLPSHLIFQTASGERRQYSINNEIISAYNLLLYGFYSQMKTVRALAQRLDLFARCVRLSRL